MSMNLNTTILIMQTMAGVRTLDVKFSDGSTKRRGTGKHYTYKTDIKDIKKDDYVVVEANDYFQVVKVTKVHETPAIDTDYVLRWVICIINDDLARIAELNANQENAKHKLANARVMLETEKLIEVAGISSEGLMQITGNVEGSIDEVANKAAERPTSDKINNGEVDFTDSYDGHPEEPR